MIVSLDANMLLLLLDKDARAPIDPATGQPLQHAFERVAYLVKTLDKKRAKIIIPTPALSELLVYAGQAGPQYIAILNRSASIQIADFCQRSAVEAADLTADAIRRSGHMRGGSMETRAKIKFDRQIVAISKVHGASVIYSDDAGVSVEGARVNMGCIRSNELPLPPANAQESLFGSSGN